MSLRDIALALFVVFLWSANMIAIKLAVFETAPLTALTIRFIIAAAVFAPFIKWPGRKAALTILQVGLLSGFCHQGFLFMSQKYMPAGLSSILMLGQVIVSTWLGWLVLKEKISWRTGIGISFGLLGIISMYGVQSVGHATILGFWLIMCSNVSIAVAFMVMKRMSSVTPATFLCLFHAAALPFIFTTSLVIDAGSWARLDQINWWMMSGVLFFQVGLVSLSHYWWQRILSRNPLSLVAPFTLLMPVLSVVMAVLFLQEVLTLRIVLSGLVVLLGVGIILIRPQKRKTPIPFVTYDI